MGVGVGSGVGWGGGGGGVGWGGRVTACAIDAATATRPALLARSAPAQVRSVLACPVLTRPVPAPASPSPLRAIAGSSTYAAAWRQMRA